MRRVIFGNDFSKAYSIISITRRFNPEKNNQPRFDHDSF